MDGCCAARRAAAAAAAAAAARRSSRWWISVFTCEFRLLTMCCCWATSPCTRRRSAARLATSLAATARWCFSTAWRAATWRSAFRTCVQDAGLRVGHAVHEVHPVHEVGERARAEDVVGEARAGALIGRDDELGQLGAGRREVALGPVQEHRVPGDRPADGVQLGDGLVIGLDGGVGAGVEGVELALCGARLGPRRRRSCRRGPASTRLPRQRASRTVLPSAHLARRAIGGGDGMAARLYHPPQTATPGVCKDFPPLRGGARSLGGLMRRLSRRCCIVVRRGVSWGRNGKAETGAPRRIGPTA